MIDMKGLLQRHRIEFLESGHHHCRVGWLQLKECPSCGSRNYHLGYNVESQTFNCYRCGVLDLKATLAKLLDCSLDGVWGRVADFRLEKHATQQRRTFSAARSAIARPPGSGSLGTAHTRYLERRGFDVERLVADWGLFGTGALSGKWSWRVCFPIRNQAGVTVAYQGRAIGDATPRYRMTDLKDCVEDPHGFLYGVDRATSDSVVIVEGATGVWRLGPGTVATLGIVWRPEQVHKLRQYRRRFVLFDPEPAAQLRARKLAEALSVFGGETEVLSGFDTDPGEFSPKLVKEIRKEIQL